MIEQVIFAALVAGLATWAFDSYMQRPEKKEPKFPDGYGARLFEDWEE